MVKKKRTKKAVDKLSVRDEIVLLRLIVEEILKMCNKPNDFLLYANVMNSLITTIEKLVLREQILLKE